MYQYWAKAFPLSILLMLRIWHSSNSRYSFYRVSSIELYTIPIKIGCAATCYARVADTASEWFFSLSYNYLCLRLPVSLMVISNDENFINCSIKLIKYIKKETIVFILAPTIISSIFYDFNDLFKSKVNWIIAPCKNYPDVKL